MPLRTFVDGESPSAADFNRYFMQQIMIRKLVTESVSLNATAQPDNELFCTVNAGETYFVNMFLLYDGLAAADIEVSFTGPAGATFDYVSDGVIQSAAATIDRLSRTHQVLTTSFPTGGCFGVGTSVAMLLKGILIVDTTPGTFQFNWSQFVSNATATRVLADSVMMLRRLTD